MCAKTRVDDLEHRRPLLGNENKKYGAMSVRREEIWEKPDGGWGWIIVLGVAISNMTTQSLISNFSLLFIQRLYELEIETSGAAVILSVQATILNFSGLFTGPVIKMFTPRKVAAFGGVLFASGLLLTALSKSMLTLILTYSLFTGLGLGFLQPSTFVILDSYFSTRRGRAVGLATAGTGVGQMLLPQAVRIFLDYYGFQGTVIILSGLSLHSLVAASLYRPVKWHMKKKIEFIEESEEKWLKPEEEETFLTSSHMETKSVGKQLHKLHFMIVSLGVYPSQVGTAYVEGKTSRLQTSGFLQVPKIGHCRDEGTSPDNCDQRNQTEVSGVNRSALKEIKEGKRAKSDTFKKIVRIMDLTLLKDPSFINILVGLALVYTANINFTLIYPFLLQNIGFGKADIALCMTILAGADILGRLLMPVITDFLKIRSRTSFFFGAVLSALARSALTTQHDLVFVLLMSAVTGLVRAALIVNFNLTITEHVSQDKLPAALGLHMVFKGLCIISFGPLIGFIRDYTKSYTLCIHILSLFFLIVPAVGCFTEYLIVKCCRSRSRTDNGIE